VKKKFTTSPFNTASGAGHKLNKNSLPLAYKVLISTNEILTTLSQGVNMMVQIFAVLYLVLNHDEYQLWGSTKCELGVGDSTLALRNVNS